MLPSFAEEALALSQGYRRVAGIDEVGRGALAGPVVAAAVIMPQRPDAPWAAGVRDSKQLTPARRELLSRHISEAALAVGVGVVERVWIDSIGIARATRRAMKLAVEQLSSPAEYLLIDYLRLPEVELPQKGIVGGDSMCFSIACASIIAKVARDRLMGALDGDYPGYGLARHKGYGTREHLASLARLGPCPEHRRFFRPVRDIILQQAGGMAGDEA